MAHPRSVRPFGSVSRTRLQAWLVILAGAAACVGEHRTSGIAVAERDSAGVTVVEITGDVEALTERRLSAAPLLVIEGSEEPYFSRIGEVEWLSGGRLVVEDNQHDAVYLFDADGSYVRPLGDKGDGPGQFQNLTEMTVLPGDSVFAYDRMHGRVSLLHPHVGFVRSVPLGADFGRPLDVFASDVDRIVVQILTYGTGDGPTPRTAPIETTFFLTDGRGPVLAGPVVFRSGFVVEFESGPYLESSPHPYSSRALVAVAAGRIVHASGDRYELTVRDSDFVPIMQIRWDGWTEPVSREDVDAMRRETDRLTASVRERLPPETEEAIRRRWDAVFDPAVLPEREPALDWRSYVDESGRMWLSRFRPELLPDDVSRWHVLSPEGHPLFRLTLRAGATLAAVRGDTVMLITTDEMDVQSLEAYALEG